jgi:transcriptional regulator with XRE-family HTH domain
MAIRRSPEARGAIPAWLTRSRMAEGWTQEDLLARMSARVGWAPARSTYSSMESGRLVPPDDALGKFEEFWGTAPELEPKPEPPAPAPDPVLEAISRQTAAIEANTTAVRELLERLLPLAVQGIALGAAEAEEVARLAGVRPASPRRQRP